LLVAFVCSVASTTVLQNVDGFHLFSASLDVAAIVLVVWNFLASGRFRAKWIRQRSLTEFLRQWSVVDFAFFPGDGDLTSQFEVFKKRVERALDVRADEIEEATVALGAARLEEIRSGILKLQSIQPLVLRRYLDQRPVRQAHWFSASMARIGRQDSIRRRILIAFFGLALLAAATKLLLLIAGGHDSQTWANIPTLVLLISIGVSAASTSAYLGQNVRSLRHRYRAQLRAIELWFLDYRYIIVGAASDNPLPADAVAKVSHAIAEFEILMLNELVDWITVTEHDSMELAPT
jgi:hypothetical protein